MLVEVRQVGERTDPLIGPPNDRREARHVRLPLATNLAQYVLVADAVGQIENDDVALACRVRRLGRGHRESENSLPMM